MKPNHSRTPMHWTPEDRARHKSIRERFERAQPSPEALMASGEYNPSVLNAMYFALRQVVAELKQARQKAGLSLADVAEASGIGKAALSRLENGRMLNPTLNTLYRYAKAVGMEIHWTVNETSVSGRRPKRTVNKNKA